MVTTRRRRVRLAALSAALALVAACGSGSDGGDTVTGAAPGGAPGAPAAEQPPASGAPSNGGTATSAAPGGAPSADPAPAPEATAPTAADPGAASVVPAPGGVGAYAPVFLRPAASSRLVIEVSSQDGMAPRSATLAHLTRVLAEVSGKPVTVDAAGRVDGSGGSWTPDDLRATADAVARTGQGDGGAAVIRLLFVGGDLGGDGSVLGVAVRSDVAAVFPEQVRRSTTPLVGGSAIEEAVTVHEVGHLLGLVDLHLTTGRADPEHPGHSPNPESVMYWAVESSVVGQVLGRPPPRTFDDADRRDLATIRAS